jgi:hypothetical protein
MGRKGQALPGTIYRLEAAFLEAPSLWLLLFSADFPYFHHIFALQ